MIATADDPCACGRVLQVGDWPFCRGNPEDHTQRGHGMLGGFVARYDENIAPPPDEYFKPTGTLPEYHPGKGYYVTSLADRRRLMRLTKSDYRSHPGRSEF